MAYKLIDPQEVLDYGIDWTGFLAEVQPADSITLSSWSITPAGPVLFSDSVTGDVSRVFVAGASNGTLYQLTNRITTSQGRTAERSITLRCENR